ncbi:penicillin-binding protein 1A [Nitratireductor sp. StC3]|uniref:transglycosylase domain-containing protein n=1 Tax=Nitratireductor sp. StC3 TaxID=2126741 RepID=UPI000D0DABEE|nr:penicillin-binding protein 1A [Nitratireductor sp. StC3]PSM18158.1 penicillin-binding protein [Nitratireductor sp. StC3]
MDNPFEQKKTRAPRTSKLLEIDAWIDSSLYEAGFKAGEIWETITIFFRRFRVYGWRRGVVEALSESVTLGAAGSVVLLALAMPAFEETAGNWRAQADYAVTVLDRYGNEIGQRGIIQRDSVPVDEIPDHVIKAVLATEDRRFFDHYGIDVIGLARAMTENMRANSVVQGGSTISQQLAKNLFLSNERTIERKVKEAFLSVWLEVNLTKKEILQLYLDRAYMGGGTFGITAAADFYFDKGIKDVDLAEAAMLAGLFKAPARYAPHINLPAARARANEVLTNIVQAGFMTEGQVIAARREPANVVDRDNQQHPDYFLDWVFEEVKELAARLPTHSLVARTTLDMNIQSAAEEALEYHLRQYGKDYGVKQGAIVVIDDGGAVRAIVGGRDYGTSQFNRATRALRQVGSSFKPYVYATAMENGFTPDTIVRDAPITWGRWSPKNYSRGYRGSIPLSTALIKSINTVPVRLAKEHLGIKPIKELAEAMGIESPVFSDKTMVLGTSGLTVLDQATGFHVFANGGLAGRRHGITQLRTHSGEVVYDWRRDAPEPQRVLSEQSVGYMNSIMVQVPEIGTARRSALDGIRSAGKTGTTQAYKDAWYVGFTGNYTAAVWFGNDESTPTRNMTGGSLPAMTWKRLMTYAHNNIELKPIPGIDKPFLEGKDAPKVADAGADGDGDGEAAGRPPVMSAATTRLLRQMTRLFREAAPIRVASERDTSSAL